MLQAARAIVVAAAALIAPFAGNWTPLEKWVEPSYMVHRQGVDDYHCESYWLFESDFDTDIGRWVLPAAAGELAGIHGDGDPAAQRIRRGTMKNWNWHVVGENSKVVWAWVLRRPTHGTVLARTRSEARSAVKSLFGLDSLPACISLD